MSELRFSRRAIGLTFALFVGSGALVGCSHPVSANKNTQSEVPALAKPGKPLDCKVMQGEGSSAIDERTLGPSAVRVLSEYFELSERDLTASGATYVVECTTSLNGSTVLGQPVPLNVNGQPVDQQDCVAWDALYRDSKTAKNNAPTNHFLAVCAPTP